MNEIEIPVQLLNLILGLVAAGATWLVTAGIKGIGEAFGKELSNPAKTIAAVVAAGAVGITANLIDLAALSVSPEFTLIAQSGLAFLVTVFSAMGIQRQGKVKSGKQ